MHALRLRSAAVAVAILALVLGILVAACASTASAPTNSPSILTPTAGVDIPPLGLDGTIDAPTPPRGMSTIAASDLPPEGRHVLELIAAGGPFPYRQDGTVFQNRERLLPKESSGYYHEYTVPTPGSPDRGARRIIAGQHGERYYTSDHYDSFRWITP